MRIGPVIKARFVDRPNRFLVRCHVRGSGQVEAFLPNPGRLWELLFPGVTLYLSRPRGAHATATRKTQYTVMAVERDDRPILLHTHLANDVARHLLHNKRIPTLEDAKVVRAEVPVGHSRFDFLLRRGGREVFLEVKTCTLYGNEVAMFPDAITERGRRHLMELAELNHNGTEAMVLFLVQIPQVRWFMPDYHTDLAFSETLLDVQKDLPMLPVAIGWHIDRNHRLCLGSETKLLDIPWDYLRREVADRGSYLLILMMERDRRIGIGSLGKISFRKGHYVYVGSAMANLSARVNRHLALRKRHHWHIDYLRQVADKVVPVPIRSSARLECEIARALSGILTPGSEGFGCSDCECPTHLFRSASPPLHSSAFHAFLQAFRMRSPEEASRDG